MFAAAEPPSAISFSDRVDANNQLDGCPASAETWLMSLLRFQHPQARGAAIPFVLLLACAQAVMLHAQPVTFYTQPVTVYTQQPGTAIVFYAQTQVSEDLWPELFQVVRADLAGRAGELSNGLALDK